MNVLRIVQLNAGSLLEPDWDRRRHEIVAWIDHLEPDVVCLQELWEHGDRNTGRWLAEHASADWHLAFGGAPFDASMGADPSMRFGSAVLSRWPIEDEAVHLLPVTDDADPLAADIPWELFHVRTAGLDVFS